MPKKKPVALVKVPTQVVTGPAAYERAVRDADYVWTKAQEEASRNYDMAAHSAWQRYIAALKANGKAKSGGTDFDKQYDREREIALKVWKEVSEKADKKLKSTLDAIAGDATDES